MSTLVGVLLVCPAFGQIDPLLISPSSGSGTMSPADLESPRYTIKNKISNPATPPPVVNPTEASEEKKVEKKVEKNQVKVTKTETPTVPSPLQPVILPEKKITETNDEGDPNPPQLDVMRNILEIKTEGFFLYNESKSTYGYRQYFTNSQGIAVDANVWFQPNWGFETSFKTTINEFTVGTTDNSIIKSPEQWLSFGFAGRKTFSSSSMSPMLVGKIGYSSYQKKVTADTLQRAGLTTTGAFIELSAHLPTSQYHEWILGIEIKPLQNLVESSNSTDLSTGDSNTTNGIGFFVGGQIKMSRKNQFYWNTKYYVEKSLYSGSSRQIDPQSGQTVSNAPVQNTFLFFNIGFVWGG